MRLVTVAQRLALTSSMGHRPRQGKIPACTLPGYRRLAGTLCGAALDYQTSRLVQGPTPSILSTRIRVTYPGGGLSIGGNLTPCPIYM